MYISQFRVLNYKSYRDSTEIQFKPGFNVVTGQNNAGKTALMQALGLTFQSRPHLSEVTVPFRGAPTQNDSVVRVTFVVTPQEFIQSLRLTGSEFIFPRPDPSVSQPSGKTIEPNQRGMNDMLPKIMQRHSLSVQVIFKAVPGGSHFWEADPDDLDFLNWYRIEPLVNNGRLSFRVEIKPDGTLFAKSGPGQDGPQDVRIASATQLRARIYRFQAERFSIGKSASGSSSVLRPDATNLPEVLTVLNGNPARYEKLNRLVSEILPQVRHISVSPIGSSEVQVWVWPIDYATEKNYLAIPLDECGSGIAQVLAMLYVVVTSEHAQVIIVDEPQSFLHPGAVRKLVDVLKSYPQHQYIFATHSPTVITASDPATVTTVQWSPSDGSTFLTIDPTNARDLQLYLSEIGARLSDVFGADNILWVEGKTEEECFPKILRLVAKRSLMGTAIVGVLQTGDFSRRDRRKSFDVYRKLSQAKTLLPPTLGFIFDQECLPETEKEDLRRLGGGGLVRFLPRRMYENYLLNPGAISAVVNSISGFREHKVDVGEVQELIDQKRTDASYYCRGVQVNPAALIEGVDAARVLKEIFDELSGNRVSYDKVIHSTALTDWILQNQLEDFRTLSDFLLASFL